MPIAALLHDPDPDRRAQTVQRILREALPYFSTGATSQWSHGPWHLVCRTNEAVPARIAEDDASCCIVIGHLLDRALSPYAPGADVAPADAGFGACLRIDKQTRELQAATDFLGVFPLYHAAGKDWMMVTSCPWLVRCHPEFRAEWDLEGLAGVLLTMHLVTGQTVWRGVRRLGTGTRLLWKPGGTPVETVCRRIDPCPPRVHHPAEAIHDWMLKNLAAQTRGEEPVSVLLSGGLDSRLIAGMLRRLGCRDLRALTNGIEGDLEVQCARLVSDRLRLPHHVEEVGPQAELDSFRAAALLELASNGMNTANAFAVATMLPQGKAVTTGFSMDLFFNTRHYYTTRMHGNADGLIAFFGKWGMDDAICATLRPESEFRDAIQAVRQHQRDQVSRLGAPTIHHAAQLYETYFRQRFHVGGMAWRLGSRARPVMPAYDMSLITMLFSIPEEERIDRMLEKRILISEYPALARLPVDRNGLDTSPLLARRRRDDLLDRLTGRRPARVRPVGGHADLRYFRSMNINAPAWRHIREELEPLRDGLSGLFDAKAVRTLLPGPEAEIPLEVSIADSSCRKTLLALMVLADAMRRPTG